jgi:hypothetical protein
MHSVFFDDLKREVFRGIVPTLSSDEVVCESQSPRKQIPQPVLHRVLAGTLAAAIEPRTQPTDAYDVRHLRLTPYGLLPGPNVASTNPQFVIDGFELEAHGSIQSSWGVSQETQRDRSSAW